MSDPNGFADLLQLVLFGFLARAGIWQSQATMTPLFDVKEQKIERCERSMEAAMCQIDQFGTC